MVTFRKAALSGWGASPLMRYVERQQRTASPYASTKRRFDTSIRGVGHAVLALKDQPVNGRNAYKFGTKDQRDSFMTIPSQQRLINPDHLMDQAR